MPDEFVKMFKPGEEQIEVHPSVVDDHKRLGWKVVGEPVEATKPADPEVVDTAKPKKEKGNIRKRLGVIAAKSTPAKTESKEGE